MDGQTFFVDSRNPILLGPAPEAQSGDVEQGVPEVAPGNIVPAPPMSNYPFVPDAGGVAETIEDDQGGAGTNEWQPTIPGGDQETPIEISSDDGTSSENETPTIQPDAPLDGPRENDDENGGEEIGENGETNDLGLVGASFEESSGSRGSLCDGGES